MTQPIQQKAAETLQRVQEVTEVVLPEPSTALVPLAEADEAQSTEIKKRMAEIDISNSQSKGAWPRST